MKAFSSGFHAALRPAGAVAQPPAKAAAANDDVLMKSLLLVSFILVFLAYNLTIIPVRSTGGGLLPKTNDHSPGERDRHAVGTGLQ